MRQRFPREVMWAQREELDCWVELRVEVRFILGLHEVGVKYATPGVFVKRVKRKDLRAQECASV